MLEISVTGIICELNPPHEGHFRLISAAKAQTGGPVVCVMSGNFVQRGEPAIYRKEYRAELAMKAGANLVVELPVPFALSSAEPFAKAGVSVLEALHCGAIAFGTEKLSEPELKILSDAMLNPEIEHLTRSALDAGVAYPGARQAALKSVFGGKADELLKPNNMLAAHYVSELKRLGSRMAVLCFERTPGISSSAFRIQIREAVSGTAHPGGDPPVFPEMLDAAVLSRLRAMSAEQMREIQGAADGAGDRLYKYSRTAASIDELAKLVKTKRFALSRVRRLILSAAIGIKPVQRVPYIRVLALDEIGRKILRGASLPVISKPMQALRQTEDAEISGIISYESAATDLYRLAYSERVLRRGGTEFMLSPLYYSADSGAGSSAASSSDGSMPR